MKINKDAARAARALMRMSFVDGKIDEGRVRTFVKRFIEKKPRNYHATLAAYLRLLRLELAKRHAVVESAESLSDEVSAEVLASLKRVYGDDLTSEFTERGELIGGMRVKVGSDVWDGSIKGRLGRLAEKL